MSKNLKIRNTPLIVLVIAGLAALSLFGCVPLFEKLPHKKWGFIDKTGRMVISAQFDDVTRDQYGGCALRKHKAFCNFSQGLCAVRLGNKWGYIDKTGQFKLPAKYDNAGNFSEGLACVRIGTKYGYIDHTGNEVITPKFDFPVQVVNSFNANPDWDFTQSLIEPFEFSEGLAVAIIGGRFGYIDKLGSFVIQPTFTRAEPFYKGLASVCLHSEKPTIPSLVFINKAGKVVTTEAQHCIDYCDDVFLASNGQYGAGRRLIFLHSSGKQLFAAEFEDARIFSEGLAAVAPHFDESNNSSAFGYVNKEGTIVIPPRFNISGNNLAGNFRHGRAIVTRQETDGLGNNHNLHGVIDKTGRWIVPPKYNHISAYCNGLARSFVDNKCVYFDMDGKVAVRTNTSWGNSFSEGLAAVTEP